MSADLDDELLRFERELLAVESELKQEQKEKAEDKKRGVKDQDGVRPPHTAQATPAKRTQTAASKPAKKPKATIVAAPTIVERPDAAADEPADAGGEPGKTADESRASAREDLDAQVLYDRQDEEDVAQDRLRGRLARLKRAREMLDTAKAPQPQVKRPAQQAKGRPGMKLAFGDEELL
ncbi:hypothetical protein HK105_207028 [Polyrhizophydium stewartii]|uniref:Uncharacterized protein n=1 Tax=Polyrhizophydium stewartii TaxID=2732419 RepID=A0ABR4N1K6_9FUNG